VDNVACTRDCLEGREPSPPSVGWALEDSSGSVPVETATGVELGQYFLLNVRELFLAEERWRESVFYGWAIY